METSGDTGTSVGTTASDGSDGVTVSADSGSLDEYSAWRTGADVGERVAAATGVLGAASAPAAWPARCTAEDDEDVVW